METTEVPKVGSGTPPAADEHEVVQRDIRRTAVTPRPEPPNAETEKLIRRAAEEGLEDPVEVEDATSWLLQAFREELPQVTDKLELNVGTPQHPKWIAWEIRSIDGAVIRRIREQAMNQRAVRRSAAGNTAGAADAAFQANVRIVVEGSVNPDVKAVSSSTGLADPAAFLESALDRKQGLIDQLAAEILGLSGYDDDDVRDAVEIRAAGNS